MKFHLALLLCGVIVSSGCSIWNPLAVRSQSPEDPLLEHPKVRLVGDFAVPFGMYPVQIDSVGLVTGLRGTGSDPQPSPYRDVLLAEMQARGVEKPNSVLASANTSLVLIRGVLPPGIQKGDRFDVEVRIPSQSETTSLRGGWLLETRLKELALLPDSRIHEGHTLGLAAGPVMVDPSADAKNDAVLPGRGLVLGGGVALKSRPLMLVLKPDHQSVSNSARVESAVNKRFHSFYKGTKLGVANAQTHERIQLDVHPRYKDNIQRYVQVVRAVALRESETVRLQRLKLLEKQLLDPITSSRAALQLEAIGRQGVDVLRKGLESDDPEVRFYSAEALAYLDEGGAAEVLAEAARDVPAFRVFALAALSAMDDFQAREKLHELLNVPSAETRYGAFRALSAGNSNDSMVTGQWLDGQISYHVLDTTGPPMVHVTRSRRPEIVLFGKDQRLTTPLAAEAGNQILITSSKSGEIVVSKFAVGEPDQQRTVSTRLDEVIRAIAELGGTYPDIVQALQTAKASGALTSRFEVDALPEAGRTYDRITADRPGPSDSAGSRPSLSSPLPNLFAKSGGKPRGGGHGSSSDSGENDPKPPHSRQKQHSATSFFAKILGRGRTDQETE